MYIKTMQMECAQKKERACNSHINYVFQEAWLQQTSKTWKISNIKTRRWCESSSSEAMVIRKSKQSMESIRAYQSQTGNIVGWSHILPQEVKTNDSIVSPLKLHPPTLQDIQKKCEAIKKKVTQQEEEVTKIEHKTREQSKDELWSFHRKYRITASKCYRIASLKPTTSPTKALGRNYYSVISHIKLNK